MNQFRKIIVGIFIVFSLSSLFAQEEVYYIKSIEYKVDGITRNFAIRNAADFEIGEELTGDAALEAYIVEKRQLLINERVLEDAVILHVRGVKETDGRIPVDLVVSVKDTWNIIALPYFQYDSNEGFELTAKARDYNFLGTMQALRFDVGYEIEADALNRSRWKEGSLFIDIDSNIPFTLFNLDWKADFDHYFGYTYKDGFEYTNKTGVSLDYPVYLGTLMLGAYQGVSVNEKNSTEYRELTGIDRYEEYWYLSNWLSMDWSIPTNFFIHGFGQLHYTPGVEFRFNYRPGADIGDERRGPTSTISNALDVGRIDWVANYRRGLTGTLKNNNEYNYTSLKWDRTLSMDLTGHYPLFPWLGYSGRLKGVYHFDDPDYAGASELRGILDSDVVSQYGIYLNTDFSFRVIRFMPSQWFGIRWMRFFDFEQQWSPFMDMAMVRDKENELAFSVEDMLVSGGLEVVTFPSFMRSLYIRIGLGINFNEFYRTNTFPHRDEWEIFIGMGHHY